MLHHFDSFLFRFSGHFGIQWYGFSYLLSFILALGFLSWLVQRQRVGLQPGMVLDFLTYVMIGILIGGRLGYCLLYDPELFIRFRHEFPFWGVLAINEGGMATHGAILGFLAAALLYAHRTGISQLYLFDLGAIMAPIGMFFGRIANFMNGELVGRVMDIPNQWSFKFPHDVLSWPVYSFDRLSTLGPVVEKMGIAGTDWLRLLESYRTTPEARDQVDQILRRVVEAVQLQNFEVMRAIEPLLDFRHPYQLYAALMEGLLLFLILVFVWRKPRQSGVIGALFLVCYSILRLIGESFREPDPFIGFQWFDLTRGQWLSIVSLIVGLGFLALWGRREGLPTAGWWRAPSVKIHRRN